MAIVEIQSPEKFRKLVASGKPLVVKFGATWCGDCKELQPHFESNVGLLEEAGITVARFHLSHERKEVEGGGKKAVYPTMDHEALRKKYAPDGFPTVVFIREGRVFLSSLEDNKQTLGHFVTNVLQRMKKS
ncbi:MAG: thioredoxin family protein [Candidatus Micrarchaeota archaeon]